jgi:hypothetical protein
MKIFNAGKFALGIAIAQIACFGTVYAQLKGKILTIDQKPVEGAAVSMLLSKDSSLVKTEISEKDGAFSFSNLKPGDYLLSISIMGYKPYQSAKIDVSENQKAIVLDPIILTASDIQLKEVKVSAQKEFVEYQIDRTVVNVDALISNAGASVLEVLEKSPGVMVDQNGNISLKGQSGVLVMIDNRPTYLSAAALAAYLKSLPSNTIDQIELITNPPARYDAAGSAGVINIKTKKIKTKGLNGSLTFTPERSYYWRHNESLNFNYRSNRFNFFTNTSFNSQKSWRQLDIERRYYSENNALLSSFDQTSLFYPSSKTVNVKAGIDFYANSKTTWGIVFSGSNSRSDETRPVNSKILDAAGSIDSLIQADNSENKTFRQKGINLNFSHQYDSTGRTITFDLDYVGYNILANQSFLNDFLGPDQNLRYQEKITTNLPAKIRIYSGKTDYEHPLKNKAKLAAGFKSSYVDTDNAANYFLHQNETVSVDYDKTNRFRYKENINSAYLNLNKSFSLISIQTGLRVENTRANGHQLGNAVKKDSSFTLRYTSLFPTIYISYKLDSNNTSLNFSYGRRIGRPYYQDLNPFVFLLDKFSYFAGNPYLKPEFGNKFQVTLNYKNQFNLSLLCNYVNNMQTEVIEQTGNIFISRTGNVSRLIWGGVTLSAKFKAGNWWICNLYAEAGRNNFRGMPGDPNRVTGSTYGYIGPNSQFLFKKGWSAELSGFYITKSQSAQFDKSSLFAMNMGIQKKVLQNQGSIRLTLRDVFSSLEAYGNILNIPNTTATYRNDADTRVLSASFTYSFSKGTSNKQKRNISGSGSEEQRVKN